VKNWQKENYEATDGSLTEDKTEEEKSKNTVLNLQLVWADFKQEHQFVTRATFEEMLKKNGVVVKAINNKWVGSIKKAVLLRKLQVEREE
jgi:hypothetical protein